MRIDIWSDIMCPFCYIGKHRLLAALSELQLTEDVELIWHSFLLQPTLVTQPDTPLADHLAAEKGWSNEQTQQTLGKVIEMGKTVGVTFRFDAAVVANSKKAHRLIHVAQEQQLGTEMKGALLKAYFENGANIDGDATLLKLAGEVGVTGITHETLHPDTKYDKQVQQDLDLATQIGISGVPFFVFNNKLALSGAQEVTTFVSALKQAQETIHS